VIMLKPGEILDSSTPRSRRHTTRPAKFVAAAWHMRITPQTMRLTDKNLAVGNFCMR
jgi:hypothetical protein